MTLGLSSADGGMTVGLGNLSLLFPKNDQSCNVLACLVLKVPDTSQLTTMTTTTTMMMAMLRMMMIMMMMTTTMMMMTVMIMTNMIMMKMVQV